MSQAQEAGLANPGVPGSTGNAKMIVAVWTAGYERGRGGG